MDHLKRCHSCGQTLPVVSKAAAEVMSRNRPSAFAEFNPETVEALQTKEIGDWEKGFVASVSRLKTLSDKQQGCWNRIVAKCFPDGVIPPRATCDKPGEELDLNDIPF